jgi:putative transposase
MKSHRPPHLFLDNNWYFITAHTYNQSSLFKSQSHKTLWLNVLTDIAPIYGADLYAWVLLPNHYHILIYLKHANRLPKFIQRLHGSTAYQINKQDQA